MAIKMKCFVAMAFNFPDTDHIYEFHIAPVIEGLNMSPRHMQHLLHNSRIDQKIIAEISKCDVLIADLTYSRPSVYWEAGFAEGKGIPVIFTVRGDHFKDKEEDLYGNFKVHFELQNAPIIPWNRKGSQRFQNDLRKRLNFVTREKRADISSKIQSKKESDIFSKMSINKRLENLEREKYKTLLGPLNFMEEYSKKPEKKSPSRIARRGRKFLYKISNKKLILPRALYPMPSCTLDTLGRITEGLRVKSDMPWHKLAPHIKKFIKRKINAIRYVTVVSSLRKVRISVIDKVLKNWKPIRKSEHYCIEDLVLSYESFPVSHEILFIDHIESISDYKIKLLNLYGDLENSIPEVSFFPTQN
ncbi:MAG: hypothetical protein FVQ83_16230 [Chloroflexi bacterium]|nr:hypothetical protein [Chloroflexota bacterium]